MPNVFFAPRFPAYTDPGQPGSPSGPVSGAPSPRPVPRTYPKPQFEPEPEWHGLRHEWIDSKGNVWDLSSPDEGVWLTRNGLRGLDWPAMTQFTSKSPALAGGRWRGAIADTRDVFWPIMVTSDQGSKEWANIDRAFHASLDPTKEGVWRVTATATGRSRYLRCRHAPSGDVTLDLDPVKHGMAAYGVNLKAYQPFWEGPPEVNSWQDAAKPNFFGPSGLGPPFYVASSSATGSAAVTNNGDVATHVVWTLYGPMAIGTKVGIGDRAITLNFGWSANVACVLDPRPGAQTAILYNAVGTRIIPTPYNDVSHLIGGPLPDWNSSLVGPGETVPLSIDMKSSGGFIFSSLTPLYYRGIPT